MAMMADFARMPTDRKILLFVAAAVVLGGGYYEVSYKSLRDEVTAAQNAHSREVAQIRKADADLPKFEALKAHMTVLRKIINENEQALPTSAELPAFFETLNRKVIASGVEVKSWKQLPETKVAPFIRVPVEIEMTGTYMQIKKFFASLVPKKQQMADANGANGDQEASSDTERIVSIEDLSLTDPVAKNHEIRMTAHFRAATFRQDEASPPPPTIMPATPAPATPAPATPAPAPATHAPAPATTPAPAKLPPANTPKGAKMRVESSLHKADMRVRNATGMQETKPPAAGSADRLKGGL